jgi:ribosomal protein S27E
MEIISYNKTRTFLLGAISMTKNCPACGHVNPNIANFCMICGKKLDEEPLERTGNNDLKPLLKIRCIGCRMLIPVFSTVRPLKVQCPSCGKVGILK